MYIIYCPEEDFGQNASVVQSFYLQVSPLFIYIYTIYLYMYILINASKVFKQRKQLIWNLKFHADTAASSAR